MGVSPFPAQARFARGAWPLGVRAGRLARPRPAPRERVRRDRRRRARAGWLARWLGEKGEG
jgi:hypothetical protein